MALTIIGGGLAGSEAAWQAAKSGIPVRLFEMRPQRLTGAHTTASLGELVCSNSLRSDDPVSPSGILKSELEMAGSLIMEAARRTSVPAGGSLAVDRTLFSGLITEKIMSHPLIEVIREEVSLLPEGFCIVATGPLTSEAMTSALKSRMDSAYLSFYDAIAPIVSSESIDFTKVFQSSRYGKGGDDYINCPMDEEAYNRFYDALVSADRVVARDFENIKVFEGCMPVEVMAERGKDTLRFGPLRPVGLIDPMTGKQPYAVVQLRTENREKTAYNMVGFQCRLRWPEQERVFRLIPGLENAEFLRYGSIHRNTFINSPKLLSDDLSLKSRATLFIAGQLSGVEGYLESTAMGLLSGISAVRKMLASPFIPAPETTAHGSLLRYITRYEGEAFQPSNINLGLFPPLGKKVKDKGLKKTMIAQRALRDWEEYLRQAVVIREGVGT